MASSNISDVLLTPNDVAVRLSVSRSKAYELLANGEIRSVQVGTLRRIKLDALHEYIEGLQQGTA